MRKLLWPTRIGLVTLALVFMPAEAGDGRLSEAVLCASETEDVVCDEELNSFCVVNGDPTPDLRLKESP